MSAETERALRVLGRRFISEPPLPSGADTLRRQGEAYVVRLLRKERLRKLEAAAHPGHAEPEQVAVYLSMAYFLGDAGDALADRLYRRRTLADEQP